MYCSIDSFKSSFVNVTDVPFEPVRVVERPKPSAISISAGFESLANILLVAGIRRPAMFSRFFASHSNFARCLCSCSSVTGCCCICWSGLGCCCICWSGLICSCSNGIKRLLRESLRLKSLNSAGKPILLRS